MEDFNNKLSCLIDNWASQAKGFIDNFNDVVNSFDMASHLEHLNEMKHSIVKKSNDLFDDFSTLLKQVKENLSDFSVTVPFDESIGEKINYTIENNFLVINVSYSDETTTRDNKTSVLIPNNCDLEKMSLTTNNLKKTATINIPKIVQLKKDKEGELDEMEMETETYHQENKIKRRHTKHQSTMVRDSKGRFVRRVPTTVD